MWSDIYVIGWRCSIIDAGLLEDDAVFRYYVSG